MTTSSWIVLGLMLIIMIAAWVITRKSCSAKQYDEMQLKIRAKGYQIGFFTALFLMMVLLLLLESTLLTLVTPGFVAFAALIASLTVFAVYCILNNAFLSLRGNAKSYIVLYTIIVILDGFNTIRSIINGELLENGKLTFCSSTSAVVFVAFLVILITLLVKTARNRKEAEE